MVGSLAIGIILAIVPASGDSTASKAASPLNVRSASDLARTLAGSADAIGVASAPLASSGGNLIWKVIRDDHDPAGRRHVFARQFLRLPSGDIALVGAEIMLHYEQDGTFAAAMGAQFLHVNVSNSIRFGKDDAHRRAIAAVKAHGIVASMPYDNIPSSEREFSDKHVELLLTPTDDGEFRYAYHTHLRDDRNDPYEVILDADTEVVISAWASDAANDCYASWPHVYQPARGIPIRPDAPNRGLGANALTTPRRGFPYEGYFSFNGDITVYTELPNYSFGTTWACIPPGPNPGSTVFPVVADTDVHFYGWGVYKNAKADVTQCDTGQWNGDPAKYCWQGSAAGDALYRTMQTSQAFAALGRHGWDGYNGPSNVLIESTRDVGFCLSQCAHYAKADGDIRIPSPGAVIISPTPPPTSTPYNVAASLDMIAHEWGHAMIFQTANFDQSYPLGRQLHEGFADVIGQIVKKVIEPAGIGLEQSSDWKLGEDAGVYTFAFAGDVDDGAGHFFGGQPINMWMHHQDFGGSDVHEFGNMLNVVYYLLGAGGRNPVCVRLPSLEGCDVNITNPLGAIPAGQLLFNSIQWYLPSNTTWTQLPAYIGRAAFDIYNTCRTPGGNNAQDKQQLVRDAFRAIGFETSQPFEQCQ